MHITKSKTVLSSYRWPRHVTICKNEYLSLATVPDFLFEDGLQWLVNPRATPWSIEMVTHY